MTFQDRRAFHVGINSYVPAMGYAAEVVHGQPTEFNLGSPAASDDDIVTASVAADAVANTIVAQSYTSDARYGRNLILTISGDPGNTNVMDVYGYDYLGQPMIERFSGANGATAILYGKKAFYRVTATKVITASSNARTYKIGTGTRLGLPFKGDLAYAKEGGVQVPIFKRDFIMYADRAAAEAVSGASRWLRSPCPGYVKTLIGTPNGGGGATDPAITVELGGVAITGLTVTVDTSDTAGTTVTDTPTTAGYNANNRLVTNSLIEIVAAAAAGAFGDRLGIEISPTQFVLPVLTDPQTSTTGDPRGTYEAHVTLDAATEIRVGLIGDNSVNSSGNGGLQGIRHYGG